MNEKSCLLSTNKPFIIPDGVSYAKLLVGAATEKFGPGYGYIAANGTGALTPGLNANSVFVSNLGAEGLEYGLTCTFDAGYAHPGVLIYKNKGYGGPYDCTVEDMKALYEDWQSHLGEEIDVYLARESDLNINMNAGGGVNIFRFMLAILFGGLRHESKRVTASRRISESEDACINSGFGKRWSVRLLARIYRKLSWEYHTNDHGRLFDQHSLHGVSRKSRFDRHNVSVPDRRRRAPRSGPSYQIRYGNYVRSTEGGRWEVWHTLQTRCLVLRRGQGQNHRLDYRTCVASNATSLKEVA